MQDLKPPCHTKVVSISKVLTDITVNNAIFICNCFLKAISLLCFYFSQIISEKPTNHLIHTSVQSADRQWRRLNLCSQQNGLAGVGAGVACCRSSLDSCCDSLYDKQAFGEPGYWDNFCSIRCYEALKKIEKFRRLFKSRIFLSPKINRKIQFFMPRNIMIVENSCFRS